MSIGFEKVFEENTRVLLGGCHLRRKGASRDALNEFYRFIFFSVFFQGSLRAFDIIF